MSAYSFTRFPAFVFVALLSAAIGLSACDSQDNATKTTVTAEDAANCNGAKGATPEEQIDGCTAMIRSGAYQGDTLGMVFYNRGSAYKVLGQSTGDDSAFDKGIADLDAAVELAPHFANAYNNRGFLKKLTGDLEGALADFDRTLELDTENFEAYFNRCNTAVELKKYELAVPDCDRVIETAPTSSSPLAGVVHPLAYIARGKALYVAGEVDRAVDDFTKAIELNPASADAYYFRGRVWQSKGDDGKARADLEKAMELDDKYVKMFQRATKDAPAQAEE